MRECVLTVPYLVTIIQQGETRTVCEKHRKVDEWRTKHNADSVIRIQSAKPTTVISLPTLWNKYKSPQCRWMFTQVSIILCLTKKEKQGYK